jgi:predicted permease
MSSLRQDVRFAARTLRRSPGFATIAILTLGLGIGGATALFGVVEAVLLRPLPYDDPSRVVQLWQLTEQGNGISFSDPNFDDVKARSRSFVAMVTFQGIGAPVAVAGEVAPMSVTVVSAGFLEALDIQPERGRGFTTDEYATGAPVAIVDAGVWRSELGADPDFDREPIRIGSRLHTIIGVMPAGTAFPAGSDVWIPRDPAPTGYRTGHNWQVLARVRPDLSLDAARAELAEIAAELKEQHGDDTAMVDVEVIPLHEQLVGWVRPALLLMLLAAVFLLVVACANVVNLLLARASARRPEIAVRRALGATGGRLAKQALTESLVLSMVGGLLGLGLAWLGTKGLLATEPGILPRADGLGVNLAVLSFAIGASFLVATALGMVTSSRAMAGEVAEALGDASRSRTGGRSAHRLRSTLMALQVAMTLVLLVGAGLLGRSFLLLLSVDPGFRTEDALVVDAYLPTDLASPLDDPRRWTEAALALESTRDRLQQGLAGAPGVRAVGLTTIFPMSARGSNGTFWVLERPDEIRTLDDFRRVANDESRTGSAQYRAASSEYFRAMEIPLLRGRLFDETDQGNDLHAALISQSLADRRWPGEDPVGKLIQFGNMDGDLTPLMVVGVVGDIRERGLDAAPLTTLYANVMQRPASLRGRLTFVIIGGDEPASLVPAVTAAAREAAPEVPVRIRSIEEIFSASLAQRRFSLLLIGAFAAVSILLAVTGLYGVISYLVAQRRREWAIRLALGASRADVLGQALRGGMLLVAAGLAVGMVIALFATRLLEGLLYGIEATDFGTFVAVVALLGGVSFFASYVPAVRATRADPADALRQ